MSIETIASFTTSMRKKLLKLYDSLYAAYGPQNWWPAESSFEVIIGAILVQSTAWNNVAQAIDNLKTAQLLTPERLGECPQHVLEALIRPSGYYRGKAKKIQAFLKHLRHYYGNCLDALLAKDLASLRTELLTIYGIGEETADSILLYAAGKPIFVVDAYTYRLFTRLGWTEGKYHYGKLQNIFMSALPKETALFNEYHALIVRHGKTTCSKTPKCSACALSRQCPYPVPFKTC